MAYRYFRVRPPVKGDIALRGAGHRQCLFRRSQRRERAKQPYILVAQRRSVRALRQREALRAGMPPELAERIVSDREKFRGRALQEPDASDKGYGMTTGCEGVRFRMDRSSPSGPSACAPTGLWSGRNGMGNRMYPLAVFVWERRKGCAYGDSEVTHPIPQSDRGEPDTDGFRLAAMAPVCRS